MNTTKNTSAKEGLTTDEAVAQQLADVTNQGIERNRVAGGLEEHEIEAEGVEQKEVFPSDFGQCLDILKRREWAFENTVRGSRNERIAARDALERIRRHVARIQQGTPAPNAAISADHSIAVNTAYKTAGEKRDSKLATLKKLQDIVYVDAPQGKDSSKLSPKARLLFYIGMRESLSVVRMAYLYWKISELEEFPNTNWQERLAELNFEITRATTRSEIEEIHKQISLAKTPAAEDLATLSRNRVRGFLKDFEASAKVFVGQAVHTLAEFRKQAVDTEKSFFELFGKPWEETSLSRQYVVAIRELESLPVRQLPGYFGLNVD